MPFVWLFSSGSFSETLVGSNCPQPHAWQGPFYTGYCCHYNVLVKKVRIEYFPPETLIDIYKGYYKELKTKQVVSYCSVLNLQFLCSGMDLPPPQLSTASVHCHSLHSLRTLSFCASLRVSFYLVSAAKIQLDWCLTYPALSHPRQLKHSKHWCSGTVLSTVGPNRASRARWN